MRTIYLDKNNWLIRYYKWCWAVEPNENVDFCRLWWGFWFSPVAIIVGHGLGRSLIGWIEFGQWSQAKINSRPKKPKSVEVVAEKKDIWLAKKLDNIAEFMARHKRKVEIFFGVIGGIGIAGGVGVLGYALIVSIINHTVEFLLVCGGIIGLVAIVFAFAFIGIAFTESVMPEKIKRFFTRIGKGIGLFASFIAEGERAFKTRTCPKIKIIGIDDNHYDGEGMGEPDRQYILTEAEREYYQRYGLTSDWENRAKALKE